VFSTIIKNLLFFAVYAARLAEYHNVLKVRSNPAPTFPGPAAGVS
jgi:hypothetical protein